MSPCETFFAFGFVSTFVVALLATGLRYLPTLLDLYRFFAYQWKQPSLEKYALDKLNFYAFSDAQIEP